MTNTGFKKTIAAVLTVATIATTAVATTSTAQAGSGDFWRGAAVGAVTGAVIGHVSRRHHQPRTVYVERAPRPVYVQRGHGGSHVGWCSRKYRSYDARTDTYQPHYGGRRYCNSPYN